MDAGAGDGTDGNGNMDSTGDGNMDVGAGDDTWTVVQRKRGKGNMTGRGGLNERVNAER